MCVPGRHLSVISCKDLFHQYCSVCKLPILAVVLSRAWQRVGVVHLGVVVEIDRCIYSKHLIEISKISRLANVSRLVDQIQSVVAIVALRFDLLIPGQNQERENSK